MKQLLGQMSRLCGRINRALVGPASAAAAVIETLDETFASSSDAPGQTVLLMGQIDDFDALQTRFHPKDVDHIMRTLHIRLNGGLLARDLVKPLPGGRIACVMCPGDARSSDDILIIANQIQNLVAVPIIRDDLTSHISMSIGCAMADMATLPTGDMMFEAARVAMTQAIARGPAGLQFYTDPMGQALSLRRALRDEATGALRSGAIQAYFQPQIALDTGDVTGFEALARWQHPDRGLIPPGDFLPVLEDSGMMRALGRVMLRDALRALRKWDEAGFTVPSISVNMCAEELQHADLIADVLLQLERHKIPPKRLVIEVLETVSADEQNDPIIANLAALSELGCGLDLDDFGTGYASIKSVRRFAVDRVKIDRSFITDIANDPEQQEIVGTVLSMAQHMGVTTLAEGVETTEELLYLASAGCDHAQGYVIGRPAPLEEATDWLADYTNPVTMIETAG